MSCLIDTILSELFVISLTYFVFFQSLYPEVYVDAVPGIGPIIPDDLVNAVQKYMKSVATIQHGMVMPRNIRHYNCPPLEVLE